jgi:hypothetical protein
MHLIPELLRRIEGIPFEIIEDEGDPPSPWRGYQKCLRNPPQTTHLLIVQDDSLPVPGFVSAVHQIAEANPDTPVCLFLARLPRDASAQAARAIKQNRRYVQLGLRSFMPVVAVLWPTYKAAEFLAWADENPTLPGQREPRSDDAMGGVWKIRTRQVVKACVPSIVEHPDTTPSLIGKRAAWGVDKGRVAFLLAEDATAYDWSESWLRPTQSATTSR